MDRLGLVIGKLSYKILRIMKKQAGSYPGKKAYEISNNIMRRFKYPQNVILVTGTNGKTSTANMIAKILKSSGMDVDNNAKGDNITNGIISLLIKNSDLNFNIKRESLVVEIDELTMAQRLPEMKATHIIVGNFFRDQLDRAGEMESIIVKIGKALENYSGTLILNADDPNTYRLKYYAKKAKIVTYGIEKIETERDEIIEAKEGKFCPICEHELVYDYYQYSHIGNYRCNTCNFKRIKPDYLGYNVDNNDSSMTIDDNKCKFNLMLPYHLYNCMAAYAVTKEMNIDISFYKKCVANFHLELGRMEKIGDCLLNLTKNPTGANEVIRYLRAVKGKKQLLFLLNDNVADGNDVSWIWDVEVRNIPDLDKIICTGTRAYDMALRFKYDGYKNIDVIIDVKQAVKCLKGMDGSKFAISNYTGLFSLRKDIVDAYKNFMDVQ